MTTHNQAIYPQRQTRLCHVCHGSGGPIEIECPDCFGSGFDPTEEKPFAQCHSCYGDETQDVDICTRCGGTGEIDEESGDDDF